MRSTTAGAKVRPRLMNRRSLVGENSSETTMSRSPSSFASRLVPPRGLRRHDKHNVSYHRIPLLCEEEGRKNKKSAEHKAAPASEILTQDHAKRADARVCCKLNEPVHSIAQNALPGHVVARNRGRRGCPKRCGDNARDKNDDQKPRKHGRSVRGANHRPEKLK